MKLLSITIFTAMTSVMWAEDAPENYHPNRYSDLFNYSAFTDRVKPIVDPEVIELPDWSLVGVRKYRDEQFVTVVNLKDRKQRIEIPGPEAAELGFSLLEVEVARSFLNTKVKVQKGRESGWLGYNPKLLIAKKVPVKPISKKTPPQTQVPPTPGKRVRYVPSPK